MQKSVDRVISSVLRESCSAVCHISDHDGAEKVPSRYCVLGGSCVVEYICGLKKGNEYWNESIPKNPSCIISSCDGRFVAVSSKCEDSDIVVFERGETVGKVTLEDHDGGVGTICFSHDSKFLFSVGTRSDGTSFVFSIKDYSLSASVRFPAAFNVSHSSAGGFAKDVKRRSTAAYLFAVCGPSTLALATFNPDSQSLSFSITSVRTVRDFSSAVFSDNRELLIASTSAGELIAVQVKSNTAVGSPVVVSGSGGVTSLQFFGQILYAGGRDGSVSVFRVDSAEMCFASLRKICIEKNSSVSCMSLDGSGLNLLVGTVSGSLYSVDTSSCECVEVNHFPTSGIEQLLGWKSGDYFFSLSSNELVKWNSDFSYEIIANATQRFACGAVTPLLSLVATEEKVLGVNNGRKKEDAQFLWDFNVNFPTKIEITRNMRSCLLSTAQGEVMLYDLRSRDMRLKLKEHSGRVTDLKFFADESFAISSGKDRNLFTYDLSVGRQVTCHREQRSGITSLAICADQTTVVTSGIEKHIVLWDLRMMDPVQIIHSVSVVTCLNVCEDSVSDLALLAAGDTDGTVSLFDLRRIDSPLDTLPYMHSGAVNSVQFFSNGKYIASGGADNTIVVTRMFDPTPSSCLGAASPTVIPPLEFTSLVSS